MAAASLVLPAQGFGDLGGEGEGVEGLEEDGGYAEAGEAALVDALDFGGEEDDGDAGGGGVQLKLLEGGGAVHFGHHDVHQDGFGLFTGGGFQCPRGRRRR